LSKKQPATANNSSVRLFLPFHLEAEKEREAAPGKINNSRLIMRVSLAICSRLAAITRGKQFARKMD